ncbi:MAG: hypothetical protein ACI4E1_06335 [Lachnospira sp.]
MGNNLVRHFSYKKIKEEAEYCGCSYSAGRYIFTMLGMLFFSILAGVLFRLKPVNIVVIVVVGLSGAPFLIRKGFKIRNAERIYMDIDMYLHQMAYSFMRQPKIINALKDTGIVGSSSLSESIDEALEELKHGLGDDVYQDSLQVIEERYRNPRIKVLNKFMLEVEQKGGKYRKLMEALFEDNDRWINRGYVFSKDVRCIKRDISVGIVISVLMAFITTLISGMLNNYSNTSVSLYDNGIYQLSTTVFIVACMLFFIYICQKYDSDTLISMKSEAAVMRDYKTVMCNSKFSGVKSVIPGVVLFVAIGVVCLLFKRIIWTVCFFVMAAVILVSPVIRLSEARKSLSIEVNYAFTQWLRGVALNLQGNTLQAAIEKSVEDCPAVMQNSLEEFITALNADPSDVRPYYDFMQEFQSKDISTMTRMLYSITTVDDSNVEDTINLLIRRNYELMEKYERDRIADKESIMRFQEYIPTLLAAFKIGIDMMLVVMMYL